MANKYSAFGVDCERCGETVRHYYGFAGNLFCGPICLRCASKERLNKLTISEMIGDE
jgi:hypothetical protein